MKIRTSLLILLSIILNIILIFSVEYNFFYVVSLVVLIASEVFLIREIIRCLQFLKRQKSTHSEEIEILTLMDSLGYEIKFEGKPEVVLRIYYNGEYISTIRKNPEYTGYYWINGLIYNDYESENIVSVDTESLTMRLCKFKKNPELFRKGEVEYGKLYFVE